MSKILTPTTTYKPEASNGFVYVFDSKGNEVCVCYRSQATETANQISSALNSYEAVRAALLPFAEQPVSEDLSCHAGLVPMQECGRCSKILAARAALSGRNPEGVEGLEKALEKAIGIADSWIHGQLDGTTGLKSALEELEPCRAALAKYRGEA